MLAEHVRKYGTYFTAYESDLTAAIKRKAGVDITICRYYHLYISIKVLQDEELRKICFESHKIEENKHYKCKMCLSSHSYVDRHPDMLVRQGFEPKYCRTCGYVAERYQEFWDDEIAILCTMLMAGIKEQRVCHKCDVDFSLKDQVFTYSRAPTNHPERRRTQRSELLIRGSAVQVCEREPYKKPSFGAAFFVLI